MYAPSAVDAFGAVVFTVLFKVIGVGALGGIAGQRRAVKAAAQRLGRAGQDRLAPRFSMAAGIAILAEVCRNEFGVPTRSARTSRATCSPSTGPPLPSGSAASGRARSSSPAPWKSME